MKPEQPAEVQQAREVLSRFYRSTGAGEGRLDPANSGLSGAGVWSVTTGATPLALRRWPPARQDAGDIRRIHAVLAHAVARGVDFVPEPITSDGGETCPQAHGCLWELAPWMPGQADLDTDPGDRLLAAAAALRKFHDAVATSVDPRQTRELPPSIRRRAEQLDLALRIDWLSIVRESVPPSVPSDIRGALRTFAQLLPAAIEDSRAEIACVANDTALLAPTIRDARREHFLFTDQGVTGLVDFGAMVMRDAQVVDLARLLGDWAGNDAAAWVAGATAYDVSPEQSRLLAPLDFSGVTLSCGNWLRWIADGHPPDVRRLEWLSDRLACLVDHGSPVHG